MYRVLIVDDEVYAIEGLKAGVDWNRLSVNAVETAFSATQARGIFMKADIDILVCDIEMPGGSGLELLKWVNEHRPDTMTLFLTCHDTFSYIQQALRLGCFDYLLKPIPYPEFEEAILRMTSPRREKLPAGRRARRELLKPDGENGKRFRLMPIWLALLSDGQSSPVRAEVREFLENVEGTAAAQAQELARFQEDFRAMLREALRSHGIERPVRPSDAPISPLDRAGFVEWAVAGVDEVGEAIESSNKANSIVGRATDYVRRHLTENVSCEQTAHHLRLNPDYLSRVFKRGTGLSLSDHIIAAKMEIARELLRKTDVSVSQIASHIGYTNFSHFSSIFRRTTGVPPREYRRRARAELGESRQGESLEHSSSKEVGLA